MPYSMKPRWPRHDTKCPDGFTCYGWRQIHKGGYVRFAHDRHYHPDLKLCVGLWVYVTLADCYGIDVEIWIGKPWEGEPIITDKQFSPTTKDDEHEQEIKEGKEADVSAERRGAL